MLNKTIKGIFIFLLFAAILTPIWVFKDLLFPFVTSKAYYLRIVVELSLPLYLYLIVAYKQYRPNLKNPLTLAILVFWVFNLIAAFLGVNVGRSLWGNFERMGGVFYLLHLTLIYFYLLLLAKINPAWFSRFLKFAVSFAIILSLYGILVAIGMKPFVMDPSLPRISILFGNPIYVGSFLILPIFLSIFLALQSESSWESVWYWAGTGLQLLAVYLSGTRGAVVGLVIGFFLGGVAYVVMVKNRKVKIIGSSIITAFIAIIVILYAFHARLPQGTTLRRVFNLNDTNTQSRLIQWKTALKGFKDTPVFGVGPENYYIIANKYYNPEIAKFDGSWFDKPHNFLLEILVTTGIFGFLAYLGILVFSFWGIYKAYRARFFGLFELLALETGIVAYQIQNLFVFDNVSASMMFFVYTAFCAFLWIETDAIKDKNKPQKIKAGNESFAWAVFVVSLVVIFYTLYAADYMGLKIAKNVNYGFAYSSVDPQKAKDYYDTALSQPFNFDYGEVATRFSDTAINEASDTKIDSALLTSYINSAIDVMKEANARVINYPIYWYKLANAYLAKDYLAKQQFEPAGQEALQKAIDLAPNRPEALSLKAQIDSIYGNFSEAIQITQNLVDLYPFNKSLVWQLATLKKQAGMDKEAVALAENLIQNNYTFKSWREALWLLNYYSIEKEFDKAFSIFDQLIAAKNLDLDGYTALAQLYAQSGQKEKALEIAQNIIASDPSRKTQMEAFINQLK